MLLGFDPGKDKCGIAIMSQDGQIITHQIIASQEVLSKIEQLIARYQVNLVVIGNQTTSEIWQKKLQSHISIPIQPIDEHSSTLEARDLYWKMYPARGLQSLIPRGMRLPPRAIDDLVAIILLKRYLKVKN
jgi:RNase H-fold protein (predicted Holliday junction resolvase)